MEIEETRYTNGVYIFIGGVLQIRAKCLEIDFYFQKSIKYSIISIPRLFLNDFDMEVSDFPSDTYINNKYWILIP